MSETIIVAILITFMIGLSLWFIIGSKGQWFFKILMISTLSFIGLGVWFTTSDLRGWSTDDPLPDHFRIHWIIVEEPNVIYVLVENMSPVIDGTLHNIDRKSPRLHRIPYSRKAHIEGQEIINKLKQGKTVIRGTNPNGKKGQGKGEGEGQDGKHGGGDRKSGIPPFGYEYPQIELPPKLNPHNSLQNDKIPLKNDRFTQDKQCYIVDIA